jgi:hypothetical protein
MAAGVILLTGCTEESRNKFFRSADNVLGKDLKVSYVDEGKVVKTWTIRDGKITSAKSEDTGVPLGYYYFWSEENGYVQLPMDRTIVEEVKGSQKEVAAK